MCTSEISFTSSFPFSMNQERELVLSREKMDRNLNISVEEKNWGEGKGEKWGGG